MKCNMDERCVYLLNFDTITISVINLSLLKGKLWKIPVKDEGK